MNLVSGRKNEARRDTHADGNARKLKVQLRLMQELTERRSAALARDLSRESAPREEGQVTCGRRRGDDEAERRRHTR